MTHTEFQTKVEAFIDDYKRKIEVPEWFLNNIKTLLNKNITLEDWNRIQNQLKNLASENKIVYNFITDLNNYLNSFKEYVDGKNVSLLNVITKFKADIVQEIDEIYNTITFNRIGLLKVGQYEEATGEIEFIYDEDIIDTFEYDEDSGILSLTY